MNAARRKSGLTRLPFWPAAFVGQAADPPDAKPLEKLFVNQINLGI